MERMYQSRFRIMNEFCVDYLTWYPWEDVTFEEYYDLLECIHEGSVTYEVRELVVLTVNNIDKLYSDPMTRMTATEVKERNTEWFTSHK